MLDIVEILLRVRYICSCTYPHSNQWKVICIRTRNHGVVSFNIHTVTDHVVNTMINIPMTRADEYVTQSTLLIEE